LRHAKRLFRQVFFSIKGISDTLGYFFFTICHTEEEEEDDGDGDDNEEEDDGDGDDNEEEELAFAWWLKQCKIDDVLSSVKSVFFWLS
jgi:hypothetical protein